MKLVLLTNIPNPHQMPLFRALQRCVGHDNARLVFLSPVSDGREEMGWMDDERDPGVIRYWQSEQEKNEAAHWIETADVVIQGRYPIEQVRERILAEKLTFAYQERLWKKGFFRPSTLTRVYRLYRNYWSVNRNNYHFLAAGAFAAADVARLGCFRRRMWRFGYFTKPSDECDPVEKSDQILRIIWCGRLIEYKQPRLAVDIVRRAVERGAAIELKMVGDGSERQAVEDDIAAHGLQRNIDITGMVDTRRVSQEMDAADVLLFTSDRREGWGVVVNEAMNHGCCVVASDQTGGPPWLIEHGKNGLLFDGRSASQAADQLVGLAADRGYLSQLGQAGRATIQTEWSAESAARRFCQLAEGLLEGRDMRGCFEHGPCSVAEPN